MTCRCRRSATPSARSRTREPGPAREHRRRRDLRSACRAAWERRLKGDQLLVRVSSKFTSSGVSMAGAIAFASTPRRGLRSRAREGEGSRPYGTVVRRTPSDAVPMIEPMVVMPAASSCLSRVRGRPRGCSGTSITGGRAQHVVEHLVGEKLDGARVRLTRPFGHHLHDLRRLYPLRHARDTPGRVHDAGVIDENVHRADVGRPCARTSASPTLSPRRRRPLSMRRRRKA